jgi:hypothetical protein
MSLDTIKSDSTNDSCSVFNISTDDSVSATTSNSDNDVARTNNVKELFGSGVSGGDQEEVPPLIMNSASLLPEEQEMGYESASYDGHLALSNCYGDKNSFCGSFAGSAASVEADSQTLPAVTTNDDSEKENAPNETTDKDDDDISPVEQWGVNNEGESTDIKDQSQHDEESSLRSTVRDPSSNKEEKGVGEELDVSHVEMLGEDKMEEGQEQDDPSD